MEKYGLLTSEEVDNIIVNSNDELSSSEAASSATAGAAAVGCAVAAGFAA